MNYADPLTSLELLKYYLILIHLKKIISSYLFFLPPSLCSFSRLCPSAYLSFRLFCLSASLSFYLCFMYSRPLLFCYGSTLFPVALFSGRMGSPRHQYQAFSYTECPVYPVQSHNTSVLLQAFLYNNNNNRRHAFFTAQIDALSSDKQGNILNI